MNTEAQIKFDPINEVAASVISGGILASDTETPFSNFLIKSNGNESTADLNKSIKKPCTTLNESQNIIDKDLMLTGSSESRSAKKMLIPGKKELNKDQVIYRRLSKNTQVKLKAPGKQAVNTTGGKTVNKSVTIMPNGLKNISGINSKSMSKQIPGTEFSKGIKSNNRNSVGQFKTDAQNILSSKLVSETKIAARNSVTVGNVVNRNKSIQSDSVNRVLVKQFSGKDVTSERAPGVELRNGIKLNNQNVENRLKSDAQNILSSKLVSETKIAARNSVTEGNVVNRNKSIQSDFVNRVQVKQFSEKDVTNEQVLGVKLRNGIKLNNQNVGNRLKSDTHNVLSSKLGNEAKSVDRNSTLNSSDRSKNVQSNSTHMVQGKQFSGKDVKSEPNEVEKLSTGKISDTRNIAGQFKPAAQNVLKSKLGNEVKIATRNSGTGSANKIEEKQFSGKNIKNEPITGVELSKSKLLNNSINAWFDIHKNVESQNFKNRKTGKHSVNKANHNKLDGVNKVRPTGENCYNNKYLKGNIGSSDNNQRFFFQEKYFPLRSEISAIGKYKNNLDATQSISFAGLHQAEQMNNISNQSITGTGFSSAMMVQKITQIIFQSHEKQGSEMNFILDGERLGFLEVKFAQDSQGSQTTILVESDTARNLLEKVLPIINENLSQKGLVLSSLDVQVGDFSKPKTHNEKHNKNSGRSQVSNINGEVEDKINQIIAIRDYGYNTIEVLA